MKHADEKLIKYGKWLNNRWPLIGGALQRKAVRKLAENPTREVLPLLVDAIEVPDEEARRAAGTALRSLEDREVVDALCTMALQDPKGTAARICVEKGYRPSDPEDACLFLVVTRQLDAYFKEDFEFEHLHLAYDRAEEGIKAHVMEVIRSGDRRFEKFFGGRKKLVQCNHREISLFLESALRRKDWQRLFAAFMELPMKYGFPLLKHFEGSGWEPDAPDLKSLYHAALAEGRGADAAVIEPPKDTSAVFERCLANGRGEKWAHVSEQELLKRLDTATPAEGVEIVSALAKRVGYKEEIDRIVRQSPHWFVRLAGHVTGLVKDLTGGASADNNYWVKELCGLSGILEFWAAKATPVDVEAFARAPAEAFLGKVGSIRKVLRLLVTRHVEVGIHEEMIVEADETAGVMMEAD